MPMPSSAMPTQEDDFSPAVERESAVTRSYAAAFVWSIWAVFLVLAIRYTYQYGSKVPRLEDWGAVDLLTDKTRLTYDTLWGLGGGDHRAPIQVLLFYLDVKLFGPNVLPLLYLNVAFLGALAAELIWAAGQIRGRTDYTDAFFPLALLNLGHGDTFLWAQASVYVRTTFCALSVLAILLARRSRPGPGAALAAGTCLVLLPLNFAGGIPFAFLLAFWLAYLGYRQLRSPVRSERRAAWICLMSALVTLVVIASYSSGYELSRVDRRDDLAVYAIGPVDILKGTLKYMALGLGPAVRPPAWPVSGLVIPSFLAVAAVCLAFALWRRASAGRDSAIGLTLYMMACVGVSVAVAMVRVSWGREPFLNNGCYPICSIPTLLGLYFVWQVCSPPNLKPLGCMVLFSVVLSTSMLNWSYAIGLEPTWRVGALRDFERDVRAGVSIPEIISRYHGVLCPDLEKLGGYLRALRDRGLGDYRNLPPDPRFREVRLDLKPLETHNLQWNGTAGRVTRRLPYVTFGLDSPTFVCGLRLRYSNRDNGGFYPFFQVRWRDSGAAEKFEDHRFWHCFLPHDGREVEIPVWLYRTVDQIQIIPDIRPCDFTITEMVLLLPDSESRRNMPPATTSATGVTGRAGGHGG
jgi:hypothetical protein